MPRRPRPGGGAGLSRSVRRRSGFLRGLASRILGIVTGALAAAGLGIAAIWTGFAQGAVNGFVDPRPAIAQTQGLSSVPAFGNQTPVPAPAFGAPVANAPASDPVTADFGPGVPNPDPTTQLAGSAATVSDPTTRPPGGSTADTIPSGATVTGVPTG